MKTVLGFLMAAALISPSQAAMRAVPAVPSAAPLVRIAEGCGPGFARGYEGHCRPIPRVREDRREERREDRWRQERWRERAGAACPRGYHYRERDGRWWLN